MGAYVLDAVTGNDRARFEQHLAGCETCQAELRGLRETTARLAAGAAVRPPPGLREETVRAAARIPQLPPVTGDAPGAGERPDAGRRLGLLGWAGRPRAWVAGLAAGVAVLAIGAAGGLGMAMHGAEHRLDMAQDRSRQLAAVLAAPDVTMLTAEVSSGGRATVVMSHRDGALVFSASGLPELAPSQRYELWLMGPDGLRPAGMLPAARHGMTGPMVVSGLTPGDKVGLTVEPAGGSPRPTTPPILMLSLS